MPGPALLVRVDATIVAYNAPAGTLFQLPPRGGDNLRQQTGSRVADLLSAIEELKSHLRLNDAGQTGLRVDLGWAVAALQPVLSPEGEILAILITADDAGSAAARRPFRDDGVATDSAKPARTLPALETGIADLTRVARVLRRVQGRLEAWEFDQPLSARKTEFLAMLSHELRNPLAAILNALHVLQGRMTRDRLANRALLIAERQARHQARLLDDLLDASRVVLGKIELRKQDVDLGTLVRQLIADADYLFRSRAQAVTFDVSPQRIVLHGDPERLEQVFRNLLSNAAKYTGPGGHIHVSAGSDDHEAVVRVRDTGNGIDPDMLPRIFDLFVQANPTLARSEGGLGIGLTLVQYIVRLHGGTVVATSEGRGRGSEFEVRLPLGRMAAADVVPVSSPAPPARARRILLIEDNRDARQMLRILLELGGHRVEDAADAKAGIHLAVTTVPDVILIDIGLPDLDGYAVAERLRKLLGGGVRLVALTGYGDEDTRRRAMAAGFDQYLVKPVAPEVLARTIDAL